MTAYPELAASLKAACVVAEKERTARASAPASLYNLLKPSRDAAMPLAILGLDVFGSALTGRQRRKST